MAKAKNSAILAKLTDASEEDLSAAVLIMLRDGWITQPKLVESIINAAAKNLVASCD